jgi:hypothetical protein
VFLRAFRFGHVRQLDSGAGFGYCGIKGLNAVLAAASSTAYPPVIVAARLPKGSVHCARGAARLVADAINTSRRAGVHARSVLRADSAFYGRDVIAAAMRHGVRLSVTAGTTTAVTAAIAAIPQHACTPIRYPGAVCDEQLQQPISDAEVAAVPVIAFAARGTAHAVTARLIVRRVRDADPDHVQLNAQRGLFRVWRRHAVFTDSPLPMLTAEPTIPGTRSSSRSSPI